jgi:hypothetical protein
MTSQSFHKSFRPVRATLALGGVALMVGGVFVFHYNAITPSAGLLPGLEGLMFVCGTGLVTLVSARARALSGVGFAVTTAGVFGIGCFLWYGTLLEEALGAASWHLVIVMTLAIPTGMLLSTGAALWNVGYWLFRRNHSEHERCHRCGYLLRGLREPRCPECGTPFVSKSLHDPGAHGGGTSAPMDVSHSEG